MKYAPFSPEELESSREYRPGVPAYQTPITPRENWKRLYNRQQPLWVPMYTDVQSFIPRIIPDNLARAMIFEALPQKEEEKGGLDMFGVEWEYVPSVGGSMEKPGQKALLEDVNDWKTALQFPDVDAWDWAGCAERNKDYIDRTRYVQSWIFTGMFERLISFMGFENAAVALIDEEQQDAVHALFDALAELYIQIIDRLHKWFAIDGIYFHDDWGGQNGPFFSLKVCREMLVPHFKKITDFCHSNGMTFELHCCGKSEALAPAMVEMGADAWSGQIMNDKYRLREEYGDQLAIGIQFFPEDEESMRKEINQLLEKTEKNFARKPMYLQNVRPNEPMRRYLYERSRRQFIERV